MFEVPISPMSLKRFRGVLRPEKFAELERACDRAQELLAGRVVWNINSTARGGGVVELLQSLLAYARGAGVDTRWMVIEGSPEFFVVTKRIHNRLHGSLGDGGALDESAREIYERTSASNTDEFLGRVQGGDVVIVHDPQPAGLIHAARSADALAIWRCHVGLDKPNDLAREAWRFLHPYVVEAEAYVFSRASFAWENLDRERIAAIPPSIDVFSPKNQELDAGAVEAVLQASGVLPAPRPPDGVTFERQDGTRGRVERQVQLFQDQPLAPEAPVVLQVSRWDALKDPIGVIQGFADHVPPETGAHLVYAAPSVSAVTDDPEGERMLRQALGVREELPDEPRRRVHLATVPMEDPEENAIIINALQRHAQVIVQKSLAEGFGLTVSEAMWKGRPVVASRIGGIQDQIVDGETGILLDDPRDLAAYGAAVTGLLRDRERAERMGAAARERVREHFVSSRSLLDYMALMSPHLAREPAGATH